MAHSPRVFISYSRDSADHATRVRELADRLRRDGVDCTIDQYHPAPPEGWLRWMECQIEESDFVLIVCTPEYYRKAKGQEPSGAGHSVTFESGLIVQGLYDTAMRNKKFIPILFGWLDPAQILSPLRRYTRYDVDSEEGYEELLRRLTTKPPPIDRDPPIIPPPEPHDRRVLSRRALPRKWLWAAVSFSLLALSFYLYQQMSGRAYSEGLQYLARLDHVRARDSLEKAGNSPLVRSARAEALFQLGETDRALEEAKGALENSAALSSKDKLLLEARLARIQENYDKSIRLYRQLSYQGSASSLEYRLGLVEVLVEVGKSKDALEELESMQSNDPRLDYWKARAAEDVADNELQLEAAARAVQKVERKEGYSQLQAKALVLEGIAHRRKGELETALQRFKTAATLYREGGNQIGEAEARNAAAWVLFDQMRLDDAAHEWIEAKRIYNDLHDIGRVAYQDLLLGHISSQKGDLDGALKSYERSYRGFGDAGDPVGQAEALGSLGLAHRKKGDLSEATRCFEQAVAGFQILIDRGENRDEYREEKAKQLYNWAEALLAKGELGLAQKTFQDSLDVAEGVKDQRGVAAAHEGLGWILTARGKLADAQKEHEKALRLREELQEEWSLADSQLALAGIQLERGQPARAERQIQKALQTFRDDKLHDQEARTQALLARVLLEQEEPKGALNAIEEARALARDSQFPDILIEINLAEAQVCDAIGRKEAAFRILRNALDMASQSELKALALEVRLALGEIQARQGRPSSLRDLEREAGILGFGLVAEKARRPPTGRGPASSLGALQPKTACS